MIEGRYDRETFLAAGGHTKSYNEVKYNMSNIAGLAVFVLWLMSMLTHSVKSIPGINFP